MIFRFVDLNRGFLWGWFLFEGTLFFCEGGKREGAVALFLFFFSRADYLCFSLPLSLPPISDSHFLLLSYQFSGKKNPCTFLYSIHLLGNSFEIAGARVGGVW